MKVRCNRHFFFQIKHYVPEACEITFALEYFNYPCSAVRISDINILLIS